MSICDENKLWLEVEKNKPLYKILIGGKKKSLPKYGWIHTCYFCSTPTSRVKILNYKEKFYYVFQCEYCKNCILKNINDNII